MPKRVRRRVPQVSERGKYPFRVRGASLAPGTTCLCVRARSTWSFSRPTRLPHPASVERRFSTNGIDQRPPGPRGAGAGLNRDPDRGRRLARDRARHRHVARFLRRREIPPRRFRGLLRDDGGADAARGRHLREGLDHRRRGDAARHGVHLRDRGRRARRHLRCRRSTRSGGARSRTRRSSTPRRSRVAAGAGSAIYLDLPTLRFAGGRPGARPAPPAPRTGS